MIDIYIYKIRILYINKDPHVAHLLNLLAVVAENKIHRFRSLLCEGRSCRVSVDVAIRGGCAQLLRHATSFRQIRLHVKVSEQHQKRYHVDDQQVVHPQREAAIVVQRYRRRDHGDCELDLQSKTYIFTYKYYTKVKQILRRIMYQLNHSQIAFPPQIFGDGRTHGGQSIVNVHDDVHS